MWVKVRQHAFDGAFEEFAIAYFLDIGVFDAAEYLGELPKIFQRQLFLGIRQADFHPFAILDAFEKLFGGGVFILGPDQSGGGCETGSERNAA